MTVPDRRSIMPASTDLTPASTPFTLTSIMRLHSSKSCDSGWPSSIRPAQLTSSPAGPQTASASRTAASMADRSVTSTLRHIVWGRCISSMISRRRASIRTGCPSAEKRRASSLPMPELAPVTMTSSFIIVRLLCAVLTGQPVCSPMGRCKIAETRYTAIINGWRSQHKYAEYFQIVKSILL